MIVYTCGWFDLTVLLFLLCPLPTYLATCLLLLLYCTHVLTLLIHGLLHVRCIPHVIDAHLPVNVIVSALKTSTHFDRQ